MSSDAVQVEDNNPERPLARVRQTGNYSFRAAMLAAKFVFLGFVLFSAKSVSSESHLTKCCPPGQLYSGSSKVNCVSMSSNAMELHVLHSNVTVKPQGHPLCNEQEDSVTTALDDFVPGEYLEMPACLEILHDQKTKKKFVIVVHCRSNKDRQINASFPQITYVRKCCPRDSTFDRHMRTCVTKSNNSPDLFTFLPSESVDEDRVVISIEGPPKCKGLIVDYEIDEDDVVLRNGTYSVMIPALEHDSVINEEYSVTKNNTCFDMTPDFAYDRKLIVRVCRDRKYCDRNACVRKCCAQNKLFYAPGCRKHRTIKKPMEFHQVLASAINATQSSTFNITKDYGLLIGNPCLYNIFPMNPVEEKWSMTSRGYVEVEGYPVYNLDKYCMDTFYNDTLSHYNRGFYLFICSDKPGIHNINNKQYKEYIILEFISCIFLLITLLVYACLPSLQNLHGKTLMCYISSLLLAFTCLVIPWIIPVTTSNIEKFAIPCKFLAYTMLFSFLSAFSWLNVMCFDIWWTFGGLRGDTKGRKHRRRFLLYCLYAWGFSFLVSIFAIVSDYTDILPIYMRPKIGYRKCWFTHTHGLYSEMIFFIGPVTIQLISNVVFFVLTSMHCNQVKVDIKRLTSDLADPRNKCFHLDRNKFVMNIKLFIVMGISWVCEVISFFLKRYDVEWQGTIFYFPDIINCLQGLSIFILFVLKRQVYLALRKRLGLDVGKKRDCNTTTVHDPYRVRKSTSNSTLSMFVVSSAP